MYGYTESISGKAFGKKEAPQLKMKQERFHTNLKIQIKTPGSSFEDTEHDVAVAIYYPP